MICDECETEIENENDAHNFAGYGYYLHYHILCCPKFFDGSPCQSFAHAPKHPKRKPVMSTEYRVVYIKDDGSVAPTLGTFVTRKAADEYKDRLVSPHLQVTFRIQEREVPEWRDAE